MPPLKTYVFESAINSNITITIRAYDEKLAYEYLEFITKRPNDFVCL